MANDQRNRIAANSHRSWPGVLGATLFILLLPLVIVSVICQMLLGLVLLITIWCWWFPRGRDVLFVHSNSPIWQQYIGENILGRLDQRAVVLNWSERGRWRLNLAVLAFWYFGGSREFNPLAVVFRPFRLPRVFRFYGPFCEFKHGKTEAIEKMTREFLECVQ